MISRLMDGRGIREKAFSWLPYFIGGFILFVLFPILPPYARSMMTQIVIFSIFAMSLNLLIGYAGLFSVGHAAFFGVGGYATAILTKSLGISSFWIAAPAGIFVAAATAAICAVLALRAAGIYFLFITLAIGELLSAVALKWTPVTKGATGIIGIPYPDLGISVAMTEVSFYYFAAIVMVGCAFLMYRFIMSPFGRALEGIREDERLMQHFGYNTWLHKYVTFIVAGTFAGVAGILFGHFNSILVPSYLSILTSVTVVLMVIIGGTGTAFGPILGTAIVLFFQYYASVFMPERWPLILGTVFVVTVVFLPGGVSIYLLRFWNGVTRRFGSTKN